MSAQSYPMAKSVRCSSFVPSGGDVCRSADASDDFPEDGSPRRMICLEGIEREEETESRIEDHRSCGGASGEEGREFSITGDATV